MSKGSTYSAAKCTEPHEDESPCRPTWVGKRYECLYFVTRALKAEAARLVDEGVQEDGETRTAG